MKNCSLGKSASSLFSQGETDCSLCFSLPWCSSYQLFVESRDWCDNRQVAIGGSQVKSEITIEQPATLSKKIDLEESQMPKPPFLFCMFW